MQRWRLLCCKLSGRKRCATCCPPLLLGFTVALFFFVLSALSEFRIPQTKSAFPVGRRGGSGYVRKFPLQRDGGRSFQRHTQTNRTDQTKTILLWTKFFESRTWYTDENTFKHCPVSSCSVTTDRGRVHEVHAVVMNVRDFSAPSDLPPTHPPWQVWILHGSEPPYYIWQDLRLYDNVFNWTSWYRADADIFSPYGTYTTRKDDIVALDYFGRHDKLVFWAASNCYDMGRRYTRVTALRKFLPVDTFGSCGDIPCPKRSHECHKTLARYKFVLAFENGYCRDYITEKLWTAYHRWQIPIVSGGADYSQLAIPGSYIDFDDFVSVDKLARFIQRVGSDRDLYNSFFNWTRKYAVKQENGIANWCQICEALHDEERPPQAYSDISAWVGADSCPLYSGLGQLLTADLYYGLFKIFGF